MATTASLYGVDSRTRRDRYQTLKSSLWSIRQAGFDAEYQQLADYISPRRTRFWAGERNRGDRKARKILDSTCRFASRTQVAGLHSGMTNPARPWMEWSVPDKDLAKYGPVKEWLDTVTKLTLMVFQHTNLYQAFPTTYGDMGIFGTAAMSVLDDSKDLFRSYCYPIGSYAVGNDERGLATTFVREYELTVRQVVRQFGTQPGSRDIDWTRVSRTVKALWDKGQTEAPVQVTWVVTPNDDANEDGLYAKDLPWASCHFETGEDSADGQFLRESGFHEFPIMVPTWDRTGEDSYGTDSPGMIALDDVKQLMGMQRKKGQAIAKMVDPPIQGPPEVRTQKTSLLSGDMTYVASGQGQQGLRPIHEVNLDLRYLLENINDVRNAINEAFFVDLFRSVATMDEQRGAQPPTAREIDERHEEKLMGLGPLYGHMNDELYVPLADRVYAMMLRAEMLPPPPQELHGVKLTVVYTSILAQALKLVGVAGQDRFVNGVLQMAQIVGPDVLDKVDFGRVVENSADMLGIDPRIVRSAEEAKALSDARAKQQQQQMAAEQAAKLAQGAAAAGAKPIAHDSALDQILASMAGTPGGPPGVAGTAA